MVDRLDAPWERGWHFFHRHRTLTDGFGRFAEATAHFMGSPHFILYMTILVAVWVVVNVLFYQLSQTHVRDLCPFILLNPAFPIQAFYSTPPILLA